MSQPLLSVNGLMMRFGGLLAVNNVSLELREREIVSLIGPNGAGKTTVFNCLTGFYKPTGGSIMLRDQHLVYDDDVALRQTTREAYEELQSLFEADSAAQKAKATPDASSTVSPPTH